MRVRCFACDTLIDADSTEDVVDAFVVHGHEKHAWAYSHVLSRSCPFDRRPEAVVRRT